MTRAQVHALKLLLAIGSPKFCQAVVEGTPRLIINLFNAVGNQNKYSPEIDIIAKNIVTAAVENRRSFLYSEQDFYTSGLEGITRPVTTALCQNAQQIRNIGTLLSPDYSHKNAWDLEQWNAYFRLLLEAFKIHTRDSTTTTPASLQYSYRHIRQIYSDLNDNLQLNNLKYNDDLALRLKALGSLILEMVAELDKIPRHNDTETHIARLIFNLIKAASSVRSPRRVAVEIQHKLVWEGILNSCQLRTDAGLRIQEHLYAMLLNAVKKSPNLDNVRLLGYCLNTLGFTPPHKNDEYGSTWRNLHMALIEWVKKDIAKLLNKYPRMARECFVDGCPMMKRTADWLFTMNGVMVAQATINTLTWSPIPSNKKSSSAPAWPGTACVTTAPINPAAQTCCNNGTMKAVWLFTARSWRQGLRRRDCRRR